MSLARIDAGDSRAVHAALPALLSGTAPLALGFEPDAEDAVPEGTAVVIATSGSTGVPKRVVLSAAALRASAEATARRIGEGRWMLALSPGYVAGLQVLVRSRLAGHEPVVLEGRFTPEAFVEATAATVSRGGPALYTSLVPAQLATLMDAAGDGRVRTALAAYEAILIGGQALPEPLRERAADLGVRIVRTYGSSETSGGCVYDGIPLDTARVHSAEGELRITGPMLADGYLGDDALTTRAFPIDADGTRWYRTGDLGTLESGVVRVDGRADNVIISGGINVSLDRVERVVRRVPGLEQAVVLGMPDEHWGEASIVFVQATGRDAGRMLDEARAAVAVELGKHARPAQLKEMPQLPLLASGKPDRRMLRGMIADRPL